MTKDRIAELRRGASAWGGSVLSEEEVADLQVECDEMLDAIEVLIIQRDAARDGLAVFLKYYAAVVENGNGLEEGLLQVNREYKAKLEALSAAH